MSTHRNGDAREQDTALAQAKQLQPARSFAALAFDWLAVFATFALAIRLDHWLAYVVAFVFIARCQHALFMMMHEAAHYTMHPSKAVNNWVGQFAIAGPAFFSLFAYRKNHFRHHHTPTVGKSPYPMERGRFVMELLEDLLCLSYLKYAKLFFRKSKTLKPRAKAPPKNTIDAAIPIETLPHWVVISSMVLGNGVLFGFFLAFGKPLLYLLLWPLPMATVLLVLIRIRGVCEHGGFEAGLEAMQCTRTITNPVQAFFIHPHDANFHLEHHLHPTVPHYHLKRLHHDLKARDGYNEDNVYPGYGAILKTLTY